MEIELSMSSQEPRRYCVNKSIKTTDLSHLRQPIRLLKHWATLRRVLKTREKVLFYTSYQKKSAFHIFISNHNFEKTLTLLRGLDKGNDYSGAPATESIF